MSTEHVLPNWFLETAAQEQPLPENLVTVTNTFLGTLYTDPQWSVVQRELEHLSRENSIAGILQRQENALLGLLNTSRREIPDPAKVVAIKKVRENSERALAAELEATKQEFHARIDEIARQLPQAAKAAEKTPKESALAQAAARIARIVDRADLSKLGPYWMLIVLYWLLIHLTAGQLAALTLWYMVVSDTFKKTD